MERRIQMQHTERPWLFSYPEGILHEIEIPQKTLLDYLEQAVEVNGDHPALVFEGTAYTYEELADKIYRLAGGLSTLGVERGTRVALMMNNSPELVFSYYAVLGLGAIVVQNNPMYTARELLYQLKDSGAEVLIIEEKLYEGIRDELEEADLRHVVRARTASSQACTVEGLMNDHKPLRMQRNAEWMEDIAVLQYTGGTTGVSKGVMLTHRNLVANVLQVEAFMGVYCRYGKEKILNVLPLFHVYGMTVAMNLSVVLGSTLYLLERFSSRQVLEIIDRENITMFPGTPTIYVAVNGDPDIGLYDLSSIHTCISGSAPLPAEVKKLFEERTGAKLVDAYGLSEASPVTHSNPVNGKRVTGSMGLPITGTDCRIVDMHDGETRMPANTPGELIVKGPQVMKGYWNRPEETVQVLKDGWLYTGDIAYMDEEGYCFIVSRKKDVIIAGGYNIYPREVEEVLFEHPGVKEVVVAGVPDEYRGETVKAYIVPESSRVPDEEEIKAFCRERLARYKVPTLIEFRDELPKTAVGKILRRTLIEQERQKQEYT
jgi:long-chain acyl-CoA synthetase